MAASKKTKNASEKPGNPSEMSYYWMGTWQDVLNRPSEDLFSSKVLRIFLFFEDVFHLSYKNRKVKFAVFQLEKAPTTGKLHFQCYFEFLHRTRKCTLMKQFPHCFWSKRLGTARQAIDYCSKDDTRQEGPWRWGETEQDVDDNILNPDSVAPPRKKISPLQVACNHLKNGKDLKWLARNMPDVFTMHSDGLRKFISIISPPRNDKPTVLVFYGLPESNKSRRAQAIADELFPDDICRYDALGGDGQEWWQTYQGEKCVIVDEFDGRKFKWDRFLQLTDRYPVTVPIKGSHFPFLAELIIITSNLRPSMWYPQKPFGALRRRITDCRKMMCIADEMTEDGDLVFESVRDLQQMKLPDKTEHNDYLRELNRTNDFLLETATVPKSFILPTTSYITEDEYHRSLDFLEMATREILEVGGGDDVEM